MLRCVCNAVTHYSSTADAVRAAVAEIYSTGRGKCGLPVFCLAPCAPPLSFCVPAPQSSRLRRPAPTSRQLLAHASRCGVHHHKGHCNPVSSLFVCTELLRFSSAHTLLAKIPEELQRAHRQDQQGHNEAPEAVADTARNRAIARAEKKKKTATQGSGASTSADAPVDLWEGWGGQAGSNDDARDPDAAFLDLGDASLASLGL